jgi:GNAT superfamily N-acetyltransferase
MPYTLTQSRDASGNLALWHRGMPEDKWVGDHHTFWHLLSPEREVAGFCSAVYLPSERSVFLSSACVFRAHRGKDLQRKLIRHRMRWAKAQGADVVLTYTVDGNWPSAWNLLREGFHAYTPEYAWVGKAWYFKRKV